MISLFVNTWGNEAIYTEFSKWLTNYMSSGGDGDRHREHLGVSQTKKAKKKNSKRPIDPEDIAGSISSAPERISHDTHLFVVPFVGASSTSQALLSQRYEDLLLQAILRARPLSACTPSPTGASPQLSSMRIGDSSSEWSDAMAGTPPLTQCFVHPDVSPSSTSTPSVTPDDTMSALAPGQKDKLGRWHLAKDVARALKDCVRRLYTYAYHSWSEIPNNYVLGCRGTIWSLGPHLRGRHLPNCLAGKKVWDSGERPGWMLPLVFDELGQYWNIDKFKAISDQAKKVVRYTPEVQRQMTFISTENLDSLVQLTPELSTQIGKVKVVGGTHKGRCYGLGSRNDVRRLQSGLEGIGSSRQAKALDGVQIATISDQIVKLTVALAESKQRRVAEQESMSETVQQIKEQVMNLARRRTTLAPDDTDDESDKDDYVDPTP
ncbi:hypothetical protein H5410_057484 [Solanum commersonii]|uniref:Uncharacterized protein n=1 Tax=Solanum commersonii TaxID=4109 RepID=A0A9J5WQZ3_SOLCO|nr:hypothetical protein H5410_057484 [Solanum commersonii]